MTFFVFPDDGRWNPDSSCVEFSVALGGYEGVVRVPREVMQRLAGGSASPEACVEFYFIHRTRFERAAEAKLRRRELDGDGNVTLTLVDLRETRPASDA